MDYRRGEGGSHPRMKGEGVIEEGGGGTLYSVRKCDHIALIKLPHRISLSPIIFNLHLNPLKWEIV